MSRNILAIDAGTTGVTLRVYDSRAELVRQAYEEFPQYYPRPGWVEQDGEELWEVVYRLVRRVGLEDIEAIGITNQRETVLVWEAGSGRPLYRAIVWQCRRTAELCRSLEGSGERIRSKTGLVLDAYFSASKILWLRRNVEAVDKAFREGRARVGTVDTWLLWKLTGGEVHRTDHTNASRTMLYNIHQRCWDLELLDLFQVPQESLPEVHSSSYCYGVTSRELFGREVPIFSLVGDQQAALFGQGCFRRGEFKNTYGTGCFMMINTGDRAISSRAGLLTTLACRGDGGVSYALEGSVFIAGAVVQWLRDEVGILEGAAQSEELALSLEGNGGVYMVPAFVGLGAPYWSMGARGAIFGLTRGSGRAHLVRAALESIAYQTKSLVDAAVEDCGFSFERMRVDGGATANGFLMQFQADILQMELERPRDQESTSLGAALLAGLGCGYWEDVEAVLASRPAGTVFSPRMSGEEARELYGTWRRYVEAVLGVV